MRNATDARYWREERLTGFYRLSFRSMGKFPISQCHKNGGFVERRPKHK